MESEIGKGKKRETKEEGKKTRKIGRERLLKKIPASLCSGFYCEMKMI